MAKKFNHKLRTRKGRKAAVIGYGVAVLIYAIIRDLRNPLEWLLCSVLSLVIGKVVGLMAEGPDLTTHNKPRPGKEQPKEKPVEELPLSGDSEADEVITKGQEILRQIRAENNAIADEVLSGQMDELEHLCAQIFKTVSEKPNKAPQIRKFMSYYLPTTLKMLGSYRTMASRGVSVSDMTHARSETVRGMNMILTACQKQLDNLYKDTMLDVSTDIDVLEQMLKRDGLADSAFSSDLFDREAPAAAPASTAKAPAPEVKPAAPAAAASTDPRSPMLNVRSEAAAPKEERGTGKSPILEVPATAAAAQMNATRPPVLDVQSSDDDFVSFYSQERNDKK